MRLAYLLFTLAALAVLLLVLLSLPPYKITLRAPSTPTIPGGPLDPAPEGTSLAYAYLEAAGYHVATEGPEGASGIVLLNPTTCTQGVAERIRGDLERIAAERGRAFLVVAGSVECYYRLLPEAANALRGVDPRLAVGVGGELWFTAAVFNRVPPGYSVVAFSYPGGMPVAVVTVRDGVAVVAYADGVAFSNAAVREGLDHGLSPQPMLARLMEAAGARPGDTVYAPLYAFDKSPVSPAAAASILLNVRGIAASAVEWAAGLAETALAEIHREPLIASTLILLSALPLGFAGARLLTAGAPGPGAERVEPPKRVEAVGVSGYFNRLRSMAAGGEVRLDELEARRVLEALYALSDDAYRRLTGVGLGEAFQARGLLWWRRPRLPGLVEEEYERALFRLYAVYQRKVREHRLLPRVRLGEEAVRLYESLLPFLESAGVKLAGPRGLEYELRGVGEEPG